MAGMVGKEKLVLDTTALSDSDNVGAYLRDSGGALLTSQVNGAQQALDVGINVAGVQIDPRDIRALTSADVVTANQGAPNTAANGWPVKLTDGTNTASITAAGEVKVDITQPLPAGSNNIGSVNQGTSPWVVSLASTTITGTVAVTQSTSPWITKDQADGSATGGTAGAFSMLSGGIYNSTPPTLTNGQQASLQLDASGNLKVDLVTPVNVNVVSEPPDTAIKQQDVSVTGTAAKLLAAELASRKNLMLQNIGNKVIYIGKDASMTTGDGFPISAGATFAVDLGPDVSLYAISSSGTQHVRVLEFS